MSEQTELEEAIKKGKELCILCGNQAMELDDRSTRIKKLEDALEKIGELSGKSNRHIDDYGEIARAALKGGKI